MADPQYVLDASAVLPAFFDEPDANEVADRLDGALLSAVNHREIVAQLVDCGSPAAEIIDIMARMDVEVVPVDREQAEAAGLLRAATRAGDLSLGDRSCLALARLRGATAITADQDWGKLDMGVAIEVAR